MFYAKTVLGDTVTVLAELHDDNIFTRCPECGNEIEVDIAELFHDGGDLYSTSVYCAECSRKRAEDSE